MKQVSNPVLSHEIGKKLLYKCVVCNKEITELYGVWGLSGTCSRVCESVQETVEKYPKSIYENT